jgi:hypothetical protein
MTHAQIAQWPVRTTPHPFVISRTEDGFRVYAAADPGKVYEVGGSPEAPTCTCPDFRVRRGDPDSRCAHILAVLNHARQVHETARTPDSEEVEERRAIQEEGRGRPRKRTAARPNGAAQMTLKRSVSPDGRIDALSVEFSTAVDPASPEDVKASALATLALQSEIVAGFVGSRKAPRPADGDGTPNEPQEMDGGAPARLLSIGGLDGKWGRRLFISVQVNGRTAKLFGTPKQLAGALASAGFPNREIAEGVTLDLPCRAVTKPTPDGRFLDVEQILPASAPRRWS